MTATFRWFALLATLLMLSACGGSGSSGDNGGDPGNGNEDVTTGGIGVEVDLAVYFDSALPAAGDLRGVLDCGDGATVALSVGTGSAAGACTGLPPGARTVSVQFFYEYDGAEVLVFSGGRSFTVVVGETGTLQFVEGDLTFPDDNNDGISNFDQALLDVTGDTEAANALLSGLTLACDPSVGSPTDCNNLRLDVPGAPEGFQPDAAAQGQTDYTSEQAAPVNAIVVTATAANTGATVEINGTPVASGEASGPIPLAPGAVTVITIVVTAIDGRTQLTYTLSVARDRIDNADLSALSLSVGELDPVFDPGTTAYVSVVGNDVESVQVTATTDEPVATLEIGSEPAVSGEPGDGIPLDVGNNEIEIVVTAIDGTTKEYRITVIRQGDPLLSALTLTGLSDDVNQDPVTLTLEPVFSPTVLEYTAQAEFHIVEVVVTAEVSDPAASIEINGDPIPLPGIGEHLIEIVVSHPDSGVEEPLTRTYRVTVVRQEPPLFGPEAFFKPDAPGVRQAFGGAIALSADGSTLAVGAPSIPLTEDESDAGVPGVGGSAQVFIRDPGTGAWTPQGGMIVPFNSAPDDGFGHSLALSHDGDRLVVGAPRSAGAGSGVYGPDNLPVGSGPDESGAVFVYQRNGGAWDKIAYIRSEHPGEGYRFGHGVALSADGATLALGEPEESSTLFGPHPVPVDPESGTTDSAGAVHVYDWLPGGEPPAPVYFIKAPQRVTDITSHRGTGFGAAVALSADGNRLVIGMPGERSNAVEINNTGTGNLNGSGAVYLFTREAATWNAQPDYFKAQIPQNGVEFGTSVAYAATETFETLVIGAPGHSNNRQGIWRIIQDGQGSTPSPENDSGAAYAFDNAGEEWVQRVFIKAENSKAGFRFGASVALSADGDDLVVGAPGENGRATRVDGDLLDVGGEGTRSGAAFVYTREDTFWSFGAYLKVPNSREQIRFGSAVSMSADGESIAGGAPGEPGDADGGVYDLTELLPEQQDNTPNRGAAYTFRAVNPEP